jgi:hypothetical protein
MTKENEMLEQLRTGKVSIPPLSFRMLEYDSPSNRDLGLEALVEVSWNDNSATFALECKALSTPKAFQAGISQLKAATLSRNYLPMLFVPFLSEKRLLELERDKISGIDLCGNGVVTVPGMFSVYRTGGKNRFTSSAAIKNIYRKNTSMAARTFLLRPRFVAVQDICNEINSRSLLVKRWDFTAMSLSTVSKALKSLVEDLIVSRDSGIRLLQFDKLLQKLTDNYEPPNINRKVLLKFPGEAEEVPDYFRYDSKEAWMPFVATGLSSVGRYAVMQRGDLVSICCPSFDGLREELFEFEDVRFPNIELLETTDETVYFDGRMEKKLFWASPVQVFLELMAGDKRDRETAEQVRAYILNSIQGELK